uniref:Uncharacterized protein n=1 Tax=Solanum lycopersicum TaxID=4081 RepID=A0A3Q7J4E2_SOLLC
MCLKLSLYPFSEIQYVVHITTKTRKAKSSQEESLAPYMTRANPTLKTYVAAKLYRKVVGFVTRALLLYMCLIVQNVRLWFEVPRSGWAAKKKFVRLDDFDCGLTSASTP